MSFDASLGTSPIIGGMLGNDAASDAADKQMQAIMAGIAEQRREFDTGQANMAPWLKAGQGALSNLVAMMQPGGELFKTSPSMSDIEMDPGYQFGLNQSLDAIKSKMGAMGLAGSGNLGKALIDYTNESATSGYQRAYNNWVSSKNTLYNRLAGMSGTGQVAYTEMANMGANKANAVSNLLSQYGNAAASGVPNWSGPFNSMMTGLNNNMTSGIGTYMNWMSQQNMLNNLQSLYGMGGGGGGGVYGFSDPGYMSGGAGLENANFIAGDAAFAM